MQVNERKNQHRAGRKCTRNIGTKNKNLKPGLTLKDQETNVNSLTMGWNNLTNENRPKVLNYNYKKRKLMKQKQ